MEDHGKNIAKAYSYKEGDDFKDPLGLGGNEGCNQKSHYSHQHVDGVATRDKASLFDGCRGKAQANDDDHGANDNGGQELVQPACAGEVEDKGHQEVDATDEDDACLRGINRPAHGLHGILHGGYVGKGRSQVDRDLKPGQDLVDEGSQAAAKEGDRNWQTHHQGDEDCGSKHGEDVLEAQEDRLTQGGSLVDIVQEI